MVRNVWITVVCIVFAGENPQSPTGLDAMMPPRKKSPAISVFLEMILNPDNMALERLTPLIFKVASGRD